MSVRERSCTFKARLCGAAGRPTDFSDVVVVAAAAAAAVVTIKFDIKHS